MVNSVGRHLEEAAYLAGLIDGDGSIYIRLKDRKGCKTKQVLIVVAVIQRSDKIEFLKNLQALWQIGRIRVRKDGIGEWYIQKRSEVKQLLQIVYPFLKLKKRQALICLKLVESLLHNDELDFGELEKSAREVVKMNLSKKSKLLQMSP
jgi:intein/homing endonuclease